MAASKHKSRSVSKLNDPRAIASRRRIDAAFLELLHRRRYAGIRVSDITRKARVGRATFYAHFSSKHELLRAQLRDVVIPMIAVRPEREFPYDCIAFFEHVRQARPIYRSVTSGDSRLVVERIVQECLEERICAALPSRRRVAGGPVAYSVLGRFIAASLLTLIAWWIEQDAAATTEDMQHAFEALVGGGLGKPVG